MRPPISPWWLPVKLKDEILLAKQSVTRHPKLSRDLQHPILVLTRLDGLSKKSYPINRLVITQFLPGSGRVDTALWMHYLDANKMTGEEARRQLHKNVASNIEQVLAATPHKAPTIRPPASYHENYPS